MTHQETLKGRALADKLGAILSAVQEIEARSGASLSDTRCEIGELIERLADESAAEARAAFLAGFGRGVQP